MKEKQLKLYIKQIKQLGLRIEESKGNREKTQEWFSYLQGFIKALPDF